MDDPKAERIGVAAIFFIAGMLGAETVAQGFLGRLLRPCFCGTQVLLNPLSPNIHIHG
jgi:hypothetical protein